MTGFRSTGAAPTSLPDCVEQLEGHTSLDQLDENFNARGHGQTGLATTPRPRGTAHAAPGVKRRLAVMASALALIVTGIWTSIGVVSHAPASADPVATTISCSSFLGSFFTDARLFCFMNAVASSTLTDA